MADGKLVNIFRRQPLTILTWYWKQPEAAVEYTAHHVNIWADMVQRNITIPHRLVCMTANPDGIDPKVECIAPPTDFENVRIPSWGPKKPQCLRRLVMFRRDAASIFGKRFVCMDLDCVVSGLLDPLFEDDVDFKIYRGTAPGRPYNGSMMMMRAGARPQVYDEFSLEGATEAGRRFVGSDQAWISYKLGPDEAVWGAEHGVKWWESRGPNRRTDGVRLMFFPGFMKPWHIVDRNTHPFPLEHYRRSPHAGHALALGYAANVWDEASDALEQGTYFDAVIASPEAEEHWPGPILAVANDDAHAERIARMHGYTNLTFCGRTPVEPKLEMVG